MSSLQGWDLQIDSSVFKVLKKIPQRNARVIFEVIQLIPANPFFGDIQKMKGESNAWRRRVGSYRVFFKINIEEKIIVVHRLERRTSKTY